MKEFTEVLRNNPNQAYDYIASNYYKMSKEELTNIAKELLYAIHTNTTEAEHNKILKETANELMEQYDL
jgi:hypothetical protein